MKRNILEKDPWSHTPHDMFPTSCDGDTVQDISSLAFDDTGISSYGFKSSNLTSDSEFSKNDDNSYTYQLSHIPQTDDLDIFNNSCEDKESNDLLYNGWSDMGNFEDVDRMITSCDSSFGFGITGNNCNNKDEMSWFTLEDPLVGCEEALRMDFKVPSSEPSELINISQDYEPPGSDNKRSAYGFENEDEFMLKDQGAESKDAVQLGNGRGALFKKDNRMKKQLKQHQSGGKEPSQNLGHDGNWWQKRNLELDSSGYPHANYVHTPNETTAGPVLTGMKYENKGFMSPCGLESGYEPNQAHSMEHYGDPSHEFQTSFTGSPRQMGKMLQSSKWDPVSAQKQVHVSANELKNQNVVEGLQKGGLAGTGSSIVPESSSVGSQSDDISLEATSFRQLQQVMEHLDLRTKLCIKDSLYRLATSAEQRHNHAGLTGSSSRHGDTPGPLLTQQTNKCGEFMDMETDTNPIDRSIAHLLFHRPSDSSKLPASSLLTPSPMVATRLSRGTCKWRIG